MQWISQMQSAVTSRVRHFKDMFFQRPFTLWGIKISGGVCRCGVPGSRIVNGVVAPAHSVPYIVGVFHNGLYICGGTLISRNYVLSAAHCVRGKQVASISVAVGDVNSKVFRLRLKLALKPDFNRSFQNSWFEFKKIMSFWFLPLWTFYFLSTDNISHM